MQAEQSHVFLFFDGPVTPLISHLSRLCWTGWQGLSGLEHTAFPVGAEAVCVSC